MVEFMAGTPEAFVRAGLIHASNMPAGNVTWHHFLLPRHEIVRASGVWVESLFVGGALPDLVTPDQSNAIRTALGPRTHHQTARPCLRTYQAHALLARLRDAPWGTSRNKRVA